MDGIKGASAHLINRELARRGKVWQAESFDRVLRPSENLHQKVTYILENPVRRGLADRWEEYRRLWRREYDNPFAPGVMIVELRSTAYARTSGVASSRLRV